MRIFIDGRLIQLDIQSMWTFNPDGHLIHPDNMDLMSLWIKCPSGLNVQKLKTEPIFSGQ